LALANIRRLSPHGISWMKVSRGELIDVFYGGATYDLENPKYTLALVHFTGERN